MENGDILTKAFDFAHKTADDAQSQLKETKKKLESANERISELHTLLASYQQGSRSDGAHLEASPFDGSKNRPVVATLGYLERHPWVRRGVHFAILAVSALVIVSVSVILYLLYVYLSTHGPTPLMTWITNALSN